METAFVKLIKENTGIGRIIFFHPSSNAMPGFLLKKLENTIVEADKDRDIKVIVLESQGRTFCAGASFDELISLNKMDEAIDFFMGFAKVILAMKKSKKFVLTKVKGKAVGGGVGLVAASDFVMATDKAAVKLSELSIGIGPYVIAPAVKRKIGVAAFSEMSIDASRWFTAFWAREKGLFARVWDNNEQLNDEIYQLANKLSGYDEQATASLKTEIWNGTENWDKLLFEQAKISASLLLRDYTKHKLYTLKK